LSEICNEPGAERPTKGSAGEFAPVKEVIYEASQPASKSAGKQAKNRKSSAAAGGLHRIASASPRRTLHPTTPRLLSISDETRRHGSADLIRSPVELNLI
jgi:hypothetical protein